MERLAIDPPHSYDPVEVAIHVARYSIALPFVEGRTVLDSSCGEGYGSWLLAQNGATHVTGVDISPEAIQTARSKFQSPSVSFLECAADQLTSRFEHRSFDLIVSLETIEHVSDPESYLTALRTLAKDNGVIIISCPNDHWYYPETTSNPYHLRKYSFSQFQQLTQSILGDTVQWQVGTALFGYGNVDIAPLADNNLANWPNQVQVTATTYIVPSGPRHAPTASDCSYFIGIWNNSKRARQTAAYFPVSMDHGQHFNEPDHWSHFRHNYEQLTHELRRIRLEVAVLRAEHGLMVKQTQHLSMNTVPRTMLGLRAQARAIAIRQIKRNPGLFALLKRIRDTIPPSLRKHI